jgi:hypothetical protein
VRRTRRGEAVADPYSTIGDCRVTEINPDGFCSHCGMQCQQCRRELAAAEPVYRVAAGYLGKDYRLFGAVGSICAECALATRTYGEYISPVYWNQQWRTPEPCAHCSRPVILNGRRPRPKHVVCGDRCRAAVYARCAQQRKTMMPEQICAICGRHFVPTRRDAAYCSSACRRKAYRDRISAPSP